MAEEANLTWPGLKEIPLDAPGFTANGREYRVTKSLSLDRYEAYELLQVEVGFARTFQKFQAEAEEALNLCNQVATGKPVFADLATILRDMVIGCSLVDSKQTPGVLKLCSLFIVRAGEDLKGFDQGTMEDKINDWRVEGIDMGYFFAFALHSIPGFIAAYRASSRSSSANGATNQSAGERMGGEAREESTTRSE